MLIRRSLIPSVLVLLLNVAVSAQDLALDEILKKNEEALGGAEVLKSIQTLQITTKPGAAATLQNILYLKRPDCMRSELSTRGLHMINVRCGDKTWRFDPLSNPALQTAERKSEDSWFAYRAASEIHWLAGLKAAGSAVESLGTDTVRGTPAYKIKVTPPKDSSTIYYLDARTFLPLKIYTRMDLGQNKFVERERYPGDYKKADGIIFAYSTEIKMTGEYAGNSQELIENVSINAPLSDDMFTTPTPEIIAAMTKGMTLKGRLDSIKVHGESLVGNLAADSPDRPVTVYLPPSYDKEPDRRYPVIYILHGFGGNDEQYTKPVMPDNITIPAEKAFASGAREMILVIPSARTAFVGSMYSQSVTTGDWETFITKDLVSYIDRHYRTIPERASRGLAGHSMGGYGTFRIGMKYPEVFSSMYAMSACCMSPTMEPQPQVMAQIEAIKSMKDIEKESFPVMAMMASAAAWSPNPKRPPFYLDLPIENGKVRPETIAKWAANAPLTIVHQYIANLKKYHAIAFDIGDKDVVFVPNGEDVMLQASKEMDQILRDYGVEHSFEIYDGDHTNRVTRRFETSVIPFFSKNLSFPGDR